MKFFVIAASVGVAMARPDGAGGHHDHGHSAHAAAPAASASGYQEPSAGYSAPGTGYQEPSSGYEQPSGYEQSGYEQSGYETDPYQTSGYGAVEEGGFNLSMLILPVMILAGLALLFPSVTTVTVRKKRSSEDGESHKQIHNIIHTGEGFNIKKYVWRMAFLKIIFYAIYFFINIIETFPLPQGVSNSKDKYVLPFWPKNTVKTLFITFCCCLVWFLNAK